MLVGKELKLMSMDFRDGKILSVEIKEVLSQIRIDIMITRYIIVIIIVASIIKSIEK